MSLGVDNKNPWNVLMQLAKRVNGTDEVTHSDLQKLLKDADKNNDGLVELLEFKEAFLSSDQYKDLEEEYLAAFEEISKLDGDGNSISEKDINDAIAEYDKLEKETETTNIESYSSGGGSYSSDLSGNNGNNNVTSVDLSSKELPELKSERSSVLSEISSLRSEKSEALTQANADVAEAQNNYNEATKAFTEYLQDKVESEQTTNEHAKTILDYEKQKNVINSDISDKKGEISEAEKTVSTIKDNLSSLTEPPETISYFDEETQQTVSEHNTEYDNYIAQKEALENELAAAEEDLANKEDELKSLEEDLNYTETYLNAAISAYIQLEKENENLSEVEQDYLETIDEKNREYVEAKAAKDEISSEYDEKMATLQNNLTAYNDAITEKQLELPEGYGVEDGKITNGENNLAQTDKDNLPESYEIDDISITDKEGNIVGVVVGDEDSQQLYLYEEIEPDRVGVATCYEYARLFFEEAVGTAEAGSEAADIWESTDMTDVNPKDIKLIEKYYNMLVKEYNLNLQEGQTQALTYTEEAKRRAEETNSNGEDSETNSNEGSEENYEDQKANYEAIISAISKADSDATIRQNSFEAYLKENKVDISNVSEDEMSGFLDEFMEQKYGKLYNEDYYPPVTDEQLSGYIEGGLEILDEADEETVKQTVNETINKILIDDTLTPYQQIQLLNSLKSHSDDIALTVDNYFEKDDSYFYSKLDDMVSAQNDDGSFKYSSKDLIEFIKQYRNLDSTSGILASEDASNYGSYMEIILSVYDRTEEQEELSQLSTYINYSNVLDHVVENYEDDEKEKYINKLFKSIVGDNSFDSDNLSIDPADYGLDDEEMIENLKNTYLNSSGTMSEKIEKVIDDMNAGTIDRSQAQYLVSSILKGQTENISNELDKLETLSNIFELFRKEPYQAFSYDYEMVTEYVEGRGDSLLIS